MAGFPRFEFAGRIFAPRRAQFGDDAGMPGGEPVLKFVESFNGRENGDGDFNGFRLHGGSISRFAGNGKSFSFQGFASSDCGAQRVRLADEVVNLVSRPRCREFLA